MVKRVQSEILAKGREQPSSVGFPDFTRLGFAPDLRLVSGGLSWRSFISLTA
jgi:hypothetical protein